MGRLLPYGPASILLPGGVRGGRHREELEVAIMRRAIVSGKKAEGWRGGRARRGALLMEVVLSLALLVTVGMVVLSAISRSTGGLRLARERQMAVDLARSAMAKLEAGIETTTTLGGPVKAWSEDTNLAEVSEEGDDTGWELVVETEPSQFDGLTYVTITARRAVVGGFSQTGSGNAGASFTLRQLVRVVAKEEDGIGEKDDVMLEAERAFQRGYPNERERGRE